MWTWLAAFYFDVLCPNDDEDNKKVGADSRYTLNGEGVGQKFSAICWPVLSRFMISHRANSIILLYNPVDETVIFLHSLMGVKEIGTNRGVIEKAAKKLDRDDEKKRPKRGKLVPSGA